MTSWKKLPAVRIWLATCCKVTEGWSTLCKAHRPYHHGNHCLKKKLPGHRYGWAIFWRVSTLGLLVGFAALSATLQECYMLCLSQGSIGHGLQRVKRQAFYHAEHH